MKVKKIQKKSNINHKLRSIFSKFWSFEKKQNTLKIKVTIQNIKFIIKNLIVILFKFLEKKMSVILSNSNFVTSSNNVSKFKHLNLIKYRYNFNDFLKNSSLLIIKNTENWVLHKIPNIVVTTSNKILFFKNFFLSFNYFLYTENELKSVLINKLFNHCLIYYYRKNLK